MDPKEMQDVTQSAEGFGGNSADTLTDAELLAGFDEGTEGTAAAAPTTEPTADAQDSSGAEAAEAAPTTEPETAGQAQKLTFKAKIDHQDRDVTIDPEELPTLYQKANNMDRAVQRADEARAEADTFRTYIGQIGEVAKKLGFEGDTPQAAMEAMINGIANGVRESKVKELTDAGTNQEVAEFIAKEQLGLGEIPTLSSEQAQLEAQGTSEIPTPEQFSKDLQALLAKRPELAAMGNEFPEEVLQKYMGGENLEVAYLEYRMKLNAAERNGLVEQNRVLKQNQESAAKAPVKGVQGSGDVSGKEDMWTAGFDANDW